MKHFAAVFLVLQISVFCLGDEAAVLNLNVTTSQGGWRNKSPFTIKFTFTNTGTNTVYILKHKITENILRFYDYDTGEPILWERTRQVLVSPYPSSANGIYALESGTHYSEEISGEIRQPWFSRRLCFFSYDVPIKRKKIRMTARIEFYEEARQFVKALYGTELYGGELCVSNVIITVNAGGRIVIEKEKGSAP